MTYGTCTLVGNVWKVRCEPHVAMRLKHVFHGISKRSVGELEISNTLDHCRDLVWFIDRYPLDVTPMEVLRRGASQHQERVLRLRDLVAGHTPPESFAMALQPRPYQAQAAAIGRSSGGMLLADDVGLGKTPTSIATVAAPEHLPVLIVCQAHLTSQWRDEVAKFMPGWRCWITPGSKPGVIPEFLGRGPDVVITNYHRVAGWAEVLAAYCRSVIWDEVQELRRDTSAKYGAARYITLNAAMEVRLGLSATPIHNYGAEFYNVLNILAPGRLGSREEFLTEWCTAGADRDKAQISQPDAFGAWLREQGLMVRRTRSEVGRDLPPVTTVMHQVESDTASYDAIADEVNALARIILGQAQVEQGERFTAAGKLDWMMRQATGLAKAQGVATLVQMLVESGEPVILAGWHHSVYEVWESRFAKAGLRVAKYTGDETHKQKEASAAAWIAGTVDVLILSLRSGAGLNGLQERGAVVVFGELDWSWTPLWQLIGRLWRDGQGRNVVAYFCHSDDGCDPLMFEALDLKRCQLEGVINRMGDAVAHARGDGQHLLRLAESWRTQHREGA